MATHSSVLAWRIPGTGNPRSLVGCCLWGRMESDTTEVTQQQQQQDMTIQMSIGRQMHTEAVVHIYNGILLSYKQNTFESVLVRQMNLQPITQSEVSQKEKDKYHILTHIYRIQKNGTNEPMYRAAKEALKEQTFGLSLRRRGWDDLR